MSDDRPCECGAEATGYVMDRNAVSLYMQIGVTAAFPQCDDCLKHRPSATWLWWKKGDLLPFNWITGEILQEQADEERLRGHVCDILEHGRGRLQRAMLLARSPRATWQQVLDQINCGLTSAQSARRIASDAMRGEGRGEK